MADSAARNKLKWAKSDRERLRPGTTRQTLTANAAATFSEFVQSAEPLEHAPAQGHR